MNIFMKAAIAVVFGAFCLFAGNGTLALWNTSFGVQGGSISAGSLELTAANDAGWQSPSGAIDPASFKIIPGDTVKFTQSLNVKANGGGLKATFSHTPLSTSIPLEPQMIAVTLSSPSSNIHIAGDSVDVDPGSGVLVVTVTITFPAGADTGQQLSLTLNPMTFTLTQDA
jgi:alternate signal-mediated exported protein